MRVRSPSIWAGICGRPPVGQAVDVLGVLHLHAGGAEIERHHEVRHLVDLHVHPALLLAAARDLQDFILDHVVEVELSEDQVEERCGAGRRRR